MTQGLRARAPRSWKSAVAASVALVSLAMGLLVGGAPASASPPTIARSAHAPVVDTESRSLADLTRFRPGNIISDNVFFDSSAMTEQEIQAFLEARVPSCQSGYTCLKDKLDTSRSTSADAMCAAYPGAANERASRIIYKVAQACGINPRVILVTLQKEQGLVTHTWPSDWRYTIAMGQGCPDTAACDQRYYGFFNQVYGAAWQMKRYANPPGTSAYFTWYAPGKTWNIRYNPEVSCGSSPVFVENQATANLYYYTPYQPNAAALRAGYAASSDPCSAYGNRNFYNYFTDWFGSTQYPATDTPFVDVSSSPQSRVFNVFAKEIVWVAEQGISAGWALNDGAKEYRPTAAVTRDVMAAFLYRLAGQPAYTPPAQSPFVDVAVTYPFYKEIAWLASTGVSEGWQAGDRWEFRPGASVTRDVMAAFIYRFAGSPSFTPPATSPFRDVGIDHPFYAEISWLAEAQISAGWSVTGGATEYRPGIPVTRDVMAAFLQRSRTYLDPFVDVSSVSGARGFSVFAKDIAWIAQEGVSGGWVLPDGSKEYRPVSPVTRDVMAAFLYRLAGQPEFTPPAESPFVDVPVSYPFYKEISWLASTDISAGWPAGDRWEYRPGAAVTRDVMAAFLYRFAGSPAFEPPTTSAFRDVGLDHPFYREISWLAASEISAGWVVSEGVSDYRPGAPVTRDVMAAFLHRLDRLLTS